MRLRELGMSIVMILFGVCLLSGCRGARVEVSTAPSRPAPLPKTGPPPHAPAHGYRAKHVYHYYPSAYVYYEPARGRYFYYENGRWKIGVTLPNHIMISVGERVIIKMDIDRPYIKFEAHKKKHPPVKLKKRVKVKTRPTPKKIVKPKKIPRARRR